MCAFVQLCHAFLYIFFLRFRKVYFFAFLWHFLINALRFHNTAFMVVLKILKFSITKMCSNNSLKRRKAPGPSVGDNVSSGALNLTQQASHQSPTLLSRPTNPRSATASTHMHESCCRLHASILILINIFLNLHKSICSLIWKAAIRDRLDFVRSSAGTYPCVNRSPDWLSYRYI